MKITFYDNIHPTAGPWGRVPRPSIGDAARAPWVRAMHARLKDVPAGGGRFAADLDVDVGLLRMRVVRHGAALSAVWSVGADERPVAAGALLAGRDAGDDEAAVRSIRGPVARAQFREADYAALIAQPRPCLGTMYFDARWYDNGRVELPASALALAALQGPEGRLSMRDAPRHASGDLPGDPAPAAHAAAPFSTARADGLRFNFTRDRLQRVMDMVTRKGNAAIERRPGVHFRVYPPPEFLGRPGVLKGRDIYGKLGESTWPVRWYDGRCDRLAFGELLGFIDQLTEVERAFAEARGSGDGPVGSAPQNRSVWAAPDPAPDGRRTAVRVGWNIDVRKLVQDANVRRAFAAVELEPAPLPEEPAEVAAG